MSYTLPYTFVPGTKARAQEVNADFSAIIDALDDTDVRKVNTDFSNISSEAIDIIKNNSSIRNLGELIFSPIPLTDSSLHLLDGSTLQRTGIYGDFVSYIAKKYNTDVSYNSDMFSTTGTVSVTGDGIASGFSTSNYVKAEGAYPIGEDFELYLPFTPSQKTSNSEIYRATESGSFRFVCNQITNGSVMFNMTDGINGLGSPVLVQNTNLVVGDSYILVIKQKNHTCTYGYIHNGLYTQTGTKSNFPINISTITNFMIGRGANTGFDGSIDLKQFKLVINGEEIINGSKINNYFTDEESWQQSVNKYGECAKFVYNPTENTVRLPKIKGLIEYTTSTSELGELTEAGLPNITGKQNEVRRDGNPNNEGALHSSHTRTGVSSGTGGGQAADIYFDASWSNPIYGKSSTVQPQTVKYLVYIVVASTPKTNIQVDIDQIATDINGKLDKDLSNIEVSNIRNFDGQWTYKYILINNSNVSAGKYDVDLSSYLPDDQYKYEVIVNIYATQNTSTTNAFVILSSSIITEPGTSGTFSCLAVNSNSSVSGTQTIFPVGNNKILSYRLGGQNFDAMFIRLYGYRRIGTNN